MSTAKERIVKRAAQEVREGMIVNLGIGLPTPGLEVNRWGYIETDEETGATSLPGVWAGGDCAQGGEDLTVSAVQHGKVAAIDIDRQLRGVEQ